MSILLCTVALRMVKCRAPKSQRTFVAFWPVSPSPQLHSGGLITSSVWTMFHKGLLKNGVISLPEKGAVWSRLRGPGCVHFSISAGKRGRLVSA